MGTKERKEREKNERRRLILDAAKELLMLKGYKSTTMDDIAKKVELSPGTIYLYFKNKDELYASLNLIGLQFLADQIEKVYKDKRLSIEGKIFKYKDSMYSTFRYDPLLLRLILHVQLEDTLLTIDKKLLDQLNRTAKKMMTMMANTYKKGICKGKFSDGQSMAHADIMWGTFAGLLLWEDAKRKINPQKDFLKSTLDRAFEIFCRGIARKNSQKMRDV